MAPPKPEVSDDPVPGEERRMWSPTASTLIHGERDAILVDPLLTVDESRRLADWVVATGKNVIRMFVTHAHADHFLGAPAVLERFPEARVVATAEVVRRMNAQWEANWFETHWAPRFPGRLFGERVVAEPLTDGVLELEGETLRVIELGHTDSDGTSALHVPSLGLVVAGDAVYGDVHQHLAESGEDGLRDWLDALDKVEALRPRAVVAGHRREDEDEGPENIGRTRRYIEDFAAAAVEAGSGEELYATMVGRYPDRLNRAVLWRSARAVPF
ncbi:MBL fold metallo-hydrolase [Streptomyces sp. NPDC026672]|uniref:MBL fold metallo-hydrolase n=1 Tax=unclassified Streptomyces TaxID=2593676 RepID=UPI00340F9737